ncbi:hypothetical protein HYD89_03815 [Mycoplasmopsis bovis]|nr:hypothetical protein [Mycoplasmopsis bovis]QQH36270.1 hypothetical protein HYD89_03815 [Mycoplasmopsis bovis]
MLIQDKSNKEKIETAIKEAIVTKVPTSKRLRIKFKRWFKQEKRNLVSASKAFLSWSYP